MKFDSFRNTNVRYVKKEDNVATHQLSKKCLRLSSLEIVSRVPDIMTQLRLKQNQFKCIFVELKSNN